MVNVATKCNFKKHEICNLYIKKKFFLQHIRISKPKEIVKKMERDRIERAREKLEIERIEREKLERERIKKIIRKF